MFYYTLWYLLQQPRSQGLFPGLGVGHAPASQGKGPGNKIAITECFSLINNRSWNNNCSEVASTWYLTFFLIRWAPPSLFRDHLTLPPSWGTENKNYWRQDNYYNKSTNSTFRYVAGLMVVLAVLTSFVDEPEWPHKTSKLLYFHDNVSVRIRKCEH